MEEINPKFFPGPHAWTFKHAVRSQGKRLVGVGRHEHHEFINYQSWTGSARRGQSLANFSGDASIVRGDSGVQLFQGGVEGRGS
jgi:hypothetical protein